MLLDALKRFPTLTAAAGYTLLYVAFFSPVLVSGGLLAPGDGVLFNVPAFLAHRTLWTDALCAGYPAAADPQMATWYPPSLALSTLGLGGWNGYVILAYVLASTFAFGLARAVTRSTFGAVVAGTIYGLSAFMIAHVGHTNMIHTAAWIPAALWAIEELAREWRARWFAAGGLAIAMCALAGHPQVLAYGLVVVVAFATVRAPSAVRGALAYTSAAVACVGLGLAAAAIQLVPAIVLARLSPRAVLSFDEFTSYALSPSHAIELLYPYAYGGAASFYTSSYRGDWIIGEVAGYVGLMGLGLAAIGVWARRRDRMVWFWALSAVVAFVLTLGAATPLGHVLFRVPVLNGFRAPGRFFVVVSLSIALLAAYGAAAIEAGVARLRAVGAILFGEAALMLFGGLRLAAGPAHDSRSIVVPAAVFALSIVTFALWTASPKSNVRRALVCGALVADLASFGLFFPWRPAPPYSAFGPSPEARRYAELLGSSGQRIAPLGVPGNTIGVIPPNLSRIWGVASVGAYSPLVPATLSRLARIAPGGDVAADLSNANDTTLDVLAVRYVVLPGPALAPSKANADAVDLTLGNGCGVREPIRTSLELTEPTRVTALVVRSALACSTSIADDAEVGSITVVDRDQHEQRVSIRAGRDTAEWSYDCPDVAPYVRHRRAVVAESFATTRDSGAACMGHRYVATIPLEHPADIVRLEVTAADGSTLLVRSIHILDSDAVERSIPLVPAAEASDRWRLVERTDRARVYENLRARPRAWLVQHTIALHESDALEAIRTSRLPNGDSFDPAYAALVDTWNDAVEVFDGSARVVSIVTDGGTTMEVRTDSDSPALLVTSDAWYPGWRATIDGTPTPVIRVDVALRGVSVPAGEHIVKFAYRPASFIFGATTTALAFLALLWFLSRPVARATSLTSPQESAS